MDKNEKFISDLRNLFLDNHEPVSEIEFTSGNYDGQGNEIKKQLPTITTDYCEMGIYDDTVYFTFIVLSKDFTKSLFGCIKEFKNVQLYGFLDFKTILYPKKDFNFVNFSKRILNDKYLQINFNYGLSEPHHLCEAYEKIVALFVKNKIKIINQRIVNLKS